MNVRLLITTEVMKSVLWLPAQAVFQADNRKFVYAESAGNYTRKDVKLVRSSESRVVVDGLKEGQVVALANPEQTGKDSRKLGRRYTGDPAMIFADIRLAASNLRAQKIRTLLTALGIVFGVGSVIGMLAIGAGAREESLSFIEKLGVRNLLIDSRPATNDQELQQRRRSSQGLNERDVRILEANVDALETLSPRKVMRPASVLPKAARSIPELYGVTRSFGVIHNLQATEGHFFDARDDTNSAPVCVLGSTAKVELLGYGSAEILFSDGTTVRWNSPDWTKLAPLDRFMRFREAEFYDNIRRDSNSGAWPSFADYLARRAVPPGRYDSRPAHIALYRHWVVIPRPKADTLIPYGSFPNLPRSICFTRRAITDEQLPCSAASCCRPVEFAFLRAPIDADCRCHPDLLRDAAADQYAVPGSLPGAVVYRGGPDSAGCGPCDSRPRCLDSLCVAAERTPH